MRALFAPLSPFFTASLITLAALLCWSGLELLFISVRRRSPVFDRGMPPRSPYHPYTSQQIQFERLLSTEPFEVCDFLLCIVWSLDFWWASGCPVGNIGPQARRS
jgi:hypothetical protein